MGERRDVRDMSSADLVGSVSEDRFTHETVHRLGVAVRRQLLSKRVDVVAPGGEERARPQESVEGKHTRRECFRKCLGQVREVEPFHHLHQPPEVELQIE